MTHSNQSISPLRQRMIEDMTMRKLSPKTQSGYIRAVEKLAVFLGRSLAAATAEDLRLFQLHLVRNGVSSITVNATITGLRFFFETTLDRGDALAKMSYLHQPRKLPVVLSVEEVTRLLQAVTNLKHRAALSVAYGAGLRVSEVVHLKVSDIDSQRMVLRVEQGKGQRDRYAMLSPSLLQALRTWWRAAQAAGLDKRVSMHTLRHCFATHLLEQKEDIRVIQVLTRIINVAIWSDDVWARDPATLAISDSAPKHKR
jgi:integrase/recombinase XerD